MQGGPTPRSKAVDGSSGGALSQDRERVRGERGSAGVRKRGTGGSDGPRFEKRVIEGVAVDGEGTHVDSWLFEREPLVEQEGPVSTVVVVHGLGDAPVTWFPCLRHALPASRLVLPALPGAGRGPLPEGRGYLDFRRTASWLAQVVGGLVDHAPAPVTVVGHSMGGWLLERALLGDPSLARRLAPPVLVNPAGTWYEGVERERELLSPATLEEVDELLSQIYASPPEMPMEALQSLLDTMKDTGYRGLLRSPVKEDFLTADEIARLPEGTGLVWGLADGLVPQQAFEALKKGLRAPRVVEMAFCGHAPHLEAPRKMTEVLARLVP